VDLFYDPTFDPDHGVLNKEESHHCIRVKRHRLAEEIGITTGNGKVYFGTIENDSPQGVVLSEITTKVYPPPNPIIHLAVALLKNQDRYEWMTEKLTEIGVTHITPILSHYCERNRINLDRLLKKSISAIKQSHSPFLPTLSPVMKFKEFIAKPMEKNEERFIAHFEENNVKPNLTTASKITLLIGPEGGFSPEEVQKAKENGFHNLLLGNNILRTETAAVVGAAHFINNF